MALVEYWGEQKGKQFFQSWARRIREFVAATRFSHSLSRRVRMLFLLTHTVEGFAAARRAGAPVDWVNLEPVVAANNVAALAKNAPTNAAMLFLDFMLSKEGAQKVLRDVNRIPTHPEVLPNPARLREGFNFIVIDPASITTYRTLRKIVARVGAARVDFS